MFKRNRGRNWLDWQRRSLKALQWLGGGAGALLILSLFFGDMGLPRYVAMRDHVQQLTQEIKELERQTTALRGEIDRVQHDPAKIEQLARERLGYVRKGEKIYQLVPDREKAKSTP